MKQRARSIVRRTARRKERQVEEWQRISQTRRELVTRLAPVYQTASRARKQLLLDEVMQKTGYARKSTIRLLNDSPENAQTICPPRLSTQCDIINNISFAIEQISIFTFGVIAYKIDYITIFIRKLPTRVFGG